MRKTSLNLVTCILPGLFEGVSHVIILNNTWDTMAYLSSVVPAYVSKTLLTSQKNYEFLIYSISWNVAAKVTLSY